jgi:hypothetical protein
MSGARLAIGPPICPEKMAPSFSVCSAVARSSMYTPTRQFPSDICFGASSMAKSTRCAANAPRWQRQLARALPHFGSFRRIVYATIAESR